VEIEEICGAKLVTNDVIVVLWISKVLVYSVFLRMKAENILLSALVLC